MINLKVNYEFETETASRYRCFKDVFERCVEDVYDFDYDAPYAEAYIEIASRFGFDADDEARDILWMKIEEEHEADMDYTSWSMNPTDSNWQNWYYHKNPGNPDVSF